MATPRFQTDTSTDPQVGYRPLGALDIASALDRYAGPFTKRDAAHLLRRAGFGGTPDQIEALAQRDAMAAVDTLLHPTVAEADFTDYPDPVALFDVKTRNATAQNWYLDRLLRTQHPLVEKMVLFWHGHFATSINKVPPNLMVGQIDLFRSYALGNFRSLLLAVSKDPAMLVWLDNRYNVKAHPNENYAREVMELFALGLGNYTEDDIKNAARAFTGWTIDKNQAFLFKPAAHDDDEKTVLGRTGKFTGDDVVNIIVQQPAHSRFLARKLLEFFVYSDPEPELVEAVAQTYVLSGNDIAKTVGTILRSNVFYSQRAYRALPKSPIEFVIGLQRFMDVKAVPKDTIYWLQRMGQIPLAPPSVKGWDGGPTWINTATLLARFNYVNRIVKTSPPPAAVAKAAATMTSMAAPMMPAMPAMPAPAPVDLKTFAAFTPDEIVQRSGGLDATKVLATIVSDAVQDDVTSDVRETLLDYLNSTTATVPVPLGPENYQEKIRGALALTLNLPSNQLN
jgi:uncharacterized protein (DUF1800 family)